MTMPKTFEDLKYGDLQRYAKKFGIKANMKAEKLIEALTSCAVRNGLQDVQVTRDDPSAESKIEIQNVASKESQSTKPVSLCFGKSGAASKELESGRVSSAKDSKTAASHKVTGNDASASEEFKVEHSSTTVIDITDEKENAEKKQQDYLKESTFEIALTGYVCERRSKRKRSSDKEVVQNVEDEEVVFNIRENKRHCQIKTPDKPTTAKAVASSGRRRHSTYTVEDAKKETHRETQPGHGSVMNCEALSDVKVIGAAQKTSQIPRLNQPTKKRSSAVKAFTAQYWAKLHKRQFDQMDSLDVYVEKKSQRALSLLSPNHASGSVGKESRRSAQQKKNALKPVNESSFVPTVFSTTKMNTNFNQMYQNQFPSMNKKQPEKAEGGNTTSVGAKVKAAEFGSARKSLGNPFNVNTFSPGVVTSAQKSKFDLQASLSRPITWKPYVGKLKESYVKDHHLDVKKVTVKTRDDRRREMKNARAQKRLELQNERRVTGNAK